MQKMLPIRLVPVVLAVALFAAGCGSSSHRSPATAPIPPSTDAPSTVTPSTPVVSGVPTPNTGAKVQAALNYLRSPSRVAQFEAVVPKAGKLIAQALQSGRFGPVTRYDYNKQTLQPGEVTWGGIASKNNALFAWVFWNADGTINYSQPITEINVVNANGNTATGVGMFAPTTTDLTDTDGSYWMVFKSFIDNTEVTNLENIQFPGITQSTSTASTTVPPFYYPYSLDELKQLDTVGFAQLNGDMVSLFGPNWENAK